MAHGVIVHLLAANEGVKHPTLWYPTLLGILVVVAGVLLFCGSVYLLLATNLGARLGFLVTAAALTGFMMLLSLLWITTASPLNTLKGRPPSWKPVERLGEDLARSRITAVQGIKQGGRKDDPTEATNVKAALDAVIVTQKALLGEQLAPNVNKYAVYEASTDYLMPTAYEIGGGSRFRLDPNGHFPFLHFGFHEPKYAVAEICPVDKEKLKVPFGDPIPSPTCDASQPLSHLVFERDLGSLRIPPTVVFLSSLLLFGLSLLGLHWWERDEQEAAAAAEKVEQPKPSDLEPVNA